MADIFISYASADRDRIRPLVESLEADGFSVWWDRHISTGESFDRVIERELDAASCVVVVWSAGSVESDWVRNEAAEGLARGVLVPVLIDDVRPPLAFRGTQTASLLGWPERARIEEIKQLRRDVAERIARSMVNTPSEGERQEGSGSRQETDPRSIAILPFINRSQNSEDEFFADGLTEELINLLSRGSDFKVAARTSAFMFKGSTASIGTVADRLGVAFVLEGSVRKSGDRLRVNVQLIDAETGFQVWSESWEKTLVDVFQIQNEIAAAVTASLSTSKSPLAPTVRTADPAAYELYLRSTAHIGDATPQSIEQCEQLLTKALTIDLEFADAWSALGKLASNKASLKAVNTDSSFLFSIAAYERALRIDPQNVNAIAGLGWTMFYWRWRFDEAGELIRQAYDIAPNDASVLNTYATWLGKLGRREEEVALYRRAIQADPLAITTRSNLAISYINGNQVAEADAELRELRALDSDSDSTRIVAGWLALRRGMPQEALNEFQKITGSHREWASSFAYFDLGRQQESEDALTKLMELSQAPHYQVASARAYQGRVDEAFDWLDQAIANRDSWLADLRQFFAFRSLHDDPRWPAILQKVGLA